MAKVVTSHHGQIVNVPEHTAALLFPARPPPGTDRQPRPGGRASRRSRHGRGRTAASGLTQLDSIM